MFLHVERTEKKNWELQKSKFAINLAVKNSKIHYKGEGVRERDILAPKPRRGKSAWNSISTGIISFGIIAFFLFTNHFMRPKIVYTARTAQIQSKTTH